MQCEVCSVQCAVYSCAVYSACQIDEDWGPGYKNLHYWAVIRVGEAQDKTGSVLCANAVFGSHC